jgi:hypothetical protein
MPPRLFAVLIVGFWLTTSAVFFWHEYWPYLEPGAPPPFTIDLIDEAHNPVPVRWKVWRNADPDPVLIAYTNVTHHPETNEFTLSAKFTPYVQSGKPPPKQSLAINDMESEYRVNPEGQLLGVKATLKISMQLSLDGSKTTKLGGCQAHLEGVVTKGQFSGTYDLTLSQDEQEFHKNGKLPPVAVSSQGSVLMPLHPVTHVRGLRPGQSWHMPLVDPLGDALAALLPGSQPGTTVVFAKVLPEPRTLDLGKQSCECLVIEYTEEDRSGRTWVRVSDGQVMQIEATQSGDTWILQRE